MFKMFAYLDLCSYFYFSIKICIVCTQTYHFHETFILTLYLKETPFNTYANRADPDQAALVRAA